MMPPELVPASDVQAFDRLTSQTIHVWCGDLVRWNPHLHSLRALLSDGERARAARFLFDEDRTRFTLSHALLRVILAGYRKVAPEQLRFEAGPYGKPMLRGAVERLPSLQFSLSHSGAMALVAVAKERAVGVDVEYHRPGEEQVKLATRFFATSEARQIEAASEADRDRLFYRFWTAKEAYLKGRGVGLANGLDTCELLFDEASSSARVRSTESGAFDGDWSVQTLRAGEGIAAAVAVEGQGWNVELLDAFKELACSG